MLKGEGDFDKISAALKVEMASFDSKRCKDFKCNMINYLEKLLNNEEQVLLCSFIWLDKLKYHITSF